MAKPSDITKRVTITLPELIFAALEDWAADEGRPTAGLGSFILETYVRVKFPGEFGRISIESWCSTEGDRVVEDAESNDAVRRTTINLPGFVGEQLKLWAESEGRATANLAAYLIEAAVRQYFPKRFVESLRVNL